MFVSIGLTPAKSGVPAEPGLGGSAPVLQYFLLKADDGVEHCFVLDLSGWDDNTAVHEAGHSVHQFSGGLCL